MGRMIKRIQRNAIAGGWMQDPNPRRGRRIKISKVDSDEAQARTRADRAKERAERRQRRRMNPGMLASVLAVFGLGRGQR